AGAAMAWDPVAQAIVMFGGNDGQNDLAETWTWSGSTWTPHVVTGPDPRSFFGMANDGHHVVMTCGVSQPTNEGLAKTWRWNGAGWDDATPLVPVGAIANQTAFDETR